MTETDPAKSESLNLEWELHKVKADRGYQSLKEDTAFAKLHSDTEMLTFDLEMSLPTPVLTTGIVYYKRQLWTYNLGIHNTATEVGCMHMWDESVASRGSHEVGSAFCPTFKRWLHLQLTSWCTVTLVEDRTETSIWFACGCML